MERSSLLPVLSLLAITTLGAWPVREEKIPEQNSGQLGGQSNPSQGSQRASSIITDGNTEESTYLVDSNVSLANAERRTLDPHIRRAASLYDSRRRSHSMGTSSTLDLRVNTSNSAISQSASNRDERVGVKTPQALEKYIQAIIKKQNQEAEKRREGKSLVEQLEERSQRTSEIVKKLHDDKKFFETEVWVEKGSWSPFVSSETIAEKKLDKILNATIDQQTKAIRELTIKKIIAEKNAICEKIIATFRNAEEYDYQKTLRSLMEQNKLLQASFSDPYWESAAVFRSHIWFSDINHAYADKLKNKLSQNFEEGVQKEKIQEKIIKHTETAIDLLHRAKQAQLEQNLSDPDVLKELENDNEILNSKIETMEQYLAEMTECDEVSQLHNQINKLQERINALTKELKELKDEKSNTTSKKMGMSNITEKNLNDTQILLKAAQQVTNHTEKLGNNRQVSIESAAITKLNEEDLCHLIEKVVTEKVVSLEEEVKKLAHGNNAKFNFQVDYELESGNTSPIIPRQHQIVKDNELTPARRSVKSDNSEDGSTTNQTSSSDGSRDESRNSSPYDMLTASDLSPETPSLKKEK